jgi:amino acid transporter
MEAKGLIAQNTTNEEALSAWNTAPQVGGLRMIFDLPALIITILISILVYRGIKESRNFSNVMVLIKLAVVILVIGVGGALIFSNDLIGNWLPADDAGLRSFMPNGFGGVMMAVSGVFFAYIGFDAVSVLAEESKNPQRDLPRGMILSLVICTIVYILLTLVLTGAVNYRKFEGVGDPLAFIFEPQNLNVGWMQFVVALVAVVAMTSVMLVFQMGQPRIWMSMSRDGLLPDKFQEIHPRYKTPSYATIIAGLLVIVPLFFTDKTFVLDFTSIGTLFAFVLVCGGVLLIPRKQKVAGKFHLPYINAEFIFPLIILSAIIIATLITGNYFGNSSNGGRSYFSELFNGDFTNYNEAANNSDILFLTPAQKLTTIIFWGICIVLSYLAFIKKYSLIPLLGLTSCLYLLTGMSASNWMWFSVWLAIGIVVYFIYGYRKSKLNVAEVDSH